MNCGLCGGIADEGCNRFECRNCRRVPLGYGYVKESVSRIRKEMMIRFREEFTDEWIWKRLFTLGKFPIDIVNKKGVVRMIERLKSVRSF